MRYPALISHQLRVITVSVTQGDTVTPGATKHLFPPDRVFKKKLYIYARSTKRRNYILRSSSFLVQFMIFKTRLLLAIDVIMHLQ